jgi:catechol 2,3-dioxygenase-like lactoylglutathione lyase family enzyme
VDWKIEVIPVPVTDVDRAKHFYADLCGFSVDLDHQVDATTRLVQLTPPGSGCSIMLGASGSGADRVMAPGSLQGVQVVVDDVDAARRLLTGRGIEVSPVRHFEDGQWQDGPGGDWNSFAFFADPDGNGWVLQERPRRE